MPEPIYKSKELSVEDLHCAGCAATIEKTVSKLGGVQSVEAHFASGKVRVNYDPGKLTYGDLLESLEKIGHRVQASAHLQLDKKQFWRQRDFQFNLISGIAFATGLALRFLTGEASLFEMFGRTFPPSTLFFLLSIIFGAYFLAREGYLAVLNRGLNMSFLMTIAIIGAIVIQEYVEAASLAFLYSLAELLESYAVERSRSSLRELIKLAPNDAVVKLNGQEMSRPVDEVSVGDVVVVRPGEKVPLDGIVTSGISSLDQAPITGESVPIKKETGEKVFAGSINLEGYLEVRVTERSSNTMLARIIHMIEFARDQKAPSERFVDRFAKIYTPVVVFVAFAVAIVPPLIFDESFNMWFVKALTLLVIACPCALVISTPVSVVSALTSASRNGVLIKGGLFLEEMSQVRVIAMDKTGTLTKGNLRVTDVIPMNGLLDSELLTVAASLEKRSEHPIAKAIVDAAAHLNLVEVDRFEALPGRGVVGQLNGHRFTIGSEYLLEEDLRGPVKGDQEALQKAGKTTMFVSRDSEIIGLIGLMDEVRDEAADTVAMLKQAGKRVIMITGDNESTAAAIADELGIDEFQASLLPEDKVEAVVKLQKKYGKVAMIGDGINDAPALAAASVGIAMGVAGTDTALETADIALMTDDLSKLPYLVDLGRRSRKVIRQNIWASILIKLTLAAGVFPGLVSLVMAVLIGDMGASLSVTANAMRLARKPAP